MKAKRLLSRSILFCAVVRPIVPPVSRSVAWGALLWFIALLAPASTAAQVEMPLCIGYDPTQGRWGLVRFLYGDKDADCPHNHAVMYREYAVHEDLPAIDLEVTCCPLPPEALTEEHRFASNRCPEGTVITGARRTPEGGKLRCTAVNTEKYTLGERTTGARLGTFDDIGIKARMFWRPGYPPLVSRGVLPPNLRYGLGRRARLEWNDAGCIGLPWGAVLVELGEKACVNAVFQPLISREPEERPSCDGVDEVFSKKARCVSLEAQ